MDWIQESSIVLVSNIVWPNPIQKMLPYKTNSFIWSTLDGGSAYGDYYQSFSNADQIKWAMWPGMHIRLSGPCGLETGSDNLYCKQHRRSLIGWIPYLTGPKTRLDHESRPNQGRTFLGYIVLPESSWPLSWLAPNRWLQDQDHSIHNSSR